MSKAIARGCASDYVSGTLCSRSIVLFGFLLPWVRSLGPSPDPLRGGGAISVRSGDLALTLSLSRFAGEGSAFIDVFREVEAFFFQAF
jgi:hypothetical protein